MRTMNIMVVAISLIRSAMMTCTPIMKVLAVSFSLSDLLVLLSILPASSTEHHLETILDKKDATKAKRKKKKSKKKKFNHPVFENKNEERGDFKCWTCFEDSYDG